MSSNHRGTYALSIPADWPGERDKIKAAGLASKRDGGASPGTPRYTGNPAADDRVSLKDIVGKYVDEWKGGRTTIGDGSDVEDE